MKALRRLLRRRRRPAPHPGPQGEEQEIAEAERERREAANRFGESLVRKAGHSRYPFLENPYEND